MCSATVLTEAALELVEPDFEQIRAVLPPNHTLADDVRLHERFGESPAAVQCGFAIMSMQDAYRDLAPDAVLPPYIARLKDQVDVECTRDWVWDDYLMMQTMMELRWELVSKHGFVRPFATDDSYRRHAGKTGLPPSRRVDTAGLAAPNRDKIFQLIQPVYNTDAITLLPILAGEILLSICPCFDDDGRSPESDLQDIVDRCDIFVLNKRF
jgi:hypothetical protein